MTERCPPVCGDWTIRPYQDDWLEIMRDLAPTLRVHYPHGDLWLSRRLDDVQVGRARAHLALLDDQLLGIAIETPKCEGRVKLSTLWVAPKIRQCGLGTALLDRCTSHWLIRGTPCAWITVGATARRELTALVSTHGFRETSVEPHRYGTGRHEWVLHWTPEQYRTRRAEPILDPGGQGVRPAFIGGPALRSIWHTAARTVVRADGEQFPPSLADPFA
jgi:ribosomal protein S18 acetylase RimI-like enzyme